MVSVCSVLLMPFVQVSFWMSRMGDPKGQQGSSMVPSSPFWIQSVNAGAGLRHPEGMQRNCIVAICGDLCDSAPVVVSSGLL